MTQQNDLFRRPKVTLRVVMVAFFTAIAQSYLAQFTSFVPFSPSVRLLQLCAISGLFFDAEGRKEEALDYRRFTFFNLTYGGPIASLNLVD